jgi:hypothetical protein
MKTLTLSVLAGGALALSCLAPMAVVRAQDEPPPAAHSPDQGNWTLRQREDWLTSHLDQVRDDGSIDHHEYDRVKHEINDIHHDEDQMRHHQDGQLTDNETADLEGRLDHVAHQIHWLHEHSFTPPW